MNGRRRPNSARRLTPALVVASGAPVPGFDPLPDKVVCGPLEVDRRKGRAALGGISLILTQPEFALLRLLMERESRAVRRAELLAAAWSLPGDHRSNLLDLYIGRLRRRLGAHGDLIQTVGKYGYRLCIQSRRDRPPRRGSGDEG